MKIATLNLLNSTFMLRERLARLADELNDEGVDFLLLQEALRRKNAKLDIAAVLGDALGLRHSAEYHRPGTSYGLLTLSRHPLERIDVPLPSEHTQMLATGSVVGGRRVVIVNTHGAWGSFRGHDRLREAVLADDIARSAFDAVPGVKGRPLRDVRPVVVYAGDLNTTPDSPAIRFLTGRENAGERSTMWLDAWDETGQGDGHTIGRTASGEPNPLGVRDVQSRALTASYRPERVPNLRYDYVLVHEWAYGQAGEPVSARRFGTEEFTAVHPQDGTPVSLCISDHYGVLTELWMPA